MILHCRLKTEITYHDALHGFRAGRGTGTATLKAKLLQQLAAMREEILYVTSTNPIHLYSFFPFGMSTTVCHVASSVISNYRNAICVIYTSFPHRSPPSSSASVFSSPFSSASIPLLDTASHPFRCSSRIPDSSPHRFLLRLFTASAISSSLGTELSTSAGVTVTGMFSPGGGT